MEKKEADECKARHKNYSKTVLKLRQQYNEFIQTKKKSEVCQFWEGLLDMMKKLKMLIASKRDEHWEGHSQAVQDLLPIFCESDSINYLHYGPWYMKKNAKTPVRTPGNVPRISGGEVCGENQSRVFKFCVT